MHDQVPPPPDESGAGPGEEPAASDRWASSGDGPLPGDPARPPADPESAYELLQRGRALMQGRHNAQAAVVLARAASLEPGRGSILEALGRACFNAGQHDRAREVFESLLEVDPSSHYGHYALAQSLRKIGRVPEALTHLRLACAMAPDSALYREALERASASRGGTSAPG